MIFLKSIIIKCLKNHLRTKLSLKCTNFSMMNLSISNKKKLKIKNISLTKNDILMNIQNLIIRLKLNNYMINIIKKRQKFNHSTLKFSILILMTDIIMR